MKKSIMGMKKILDHPDREELISKMILDVPINQIVDALKARYTTSAEKKFVIGATTLKQFKENYLDMYQMLQDDIQNTKLATLGTEVELELAVKDNPTYKSKMMSLASQEIDVRKTIAQLATAIEVRFGQIFDSIQEDPRNINTKVDRMLVEYAEVLSGILEKFWKFTEAPNPNIATQNNISIQIIDSQVMVIQEAIKETLSLLDIESSMLFMENLNEKMAKLKAPLPESQPTTDTKLAEVKLLNETINNKLNSP
jgi:hypothetical protein